MTGFAVVWTTVSIWWQMFNFVFICSKRWFQFNSRTVRTYFSSKMTLNNWKMIAETRSYVFRWHSRSRRRRVCLSSLVIGPMDSAIHPLNNWALICPRIELCWQYENCKGIHLFLRVFPHCTRGVTFKICWELRESSFNLFLPKGFPIDE